MTDTTAPDRHTAFDRSQSLLVAGLVTIVAGLAAIGGAWAFEYAGYVPCALCLEQRWPYYLGLPLALVAVVLVLAVPRLTPLARIAMLVVGVMFLAGGLLGIYHAGVEWGFWPGPASCGLGGGVTSGGNLLEQMRATRLVPCDEAAYRFLGISLAGYNAVVSLAIAGVIAWSLRKR